ncbi:MAG: class I tRNA ligase family protein, partial [Pseudomonadota bacterium]
LDNFTFNKAIARLRELTNQIEKLDNNSLNDNDVIALKFILRDIAQLAAPFIPHIAEEIFTELQNNLNDSDNNEYQSMLNSAWPVAIEKYLVDDNVTIAIQINGKLKTTISLPKDLPKKEVEDKAFNLPEIQKIIDNKPIKKIIIVPNRIVNFVA